ncbi:MAG: hypothetical protein WDZ83_14510 [Rhizobiaceae bacterium]
MKIKTDELEQARNWIATESRTVADIADELGVHVTTLRRALRGHEKA